MREILGNFDVLQYSSPECELLYRVTDIIIVIGGLQYHSSECKLLYWMREILGIFVVLQHESLKFLSFLIKRERFLAFLMFCSIVALNVSFRIR